LLALIVHFITLACKFPGVVGPRGQSSIYERLQKFLMYVWENEKKDKDPSKRGDEGASTYKCVCNREII